LRDAASKWGQQDALIVSQEKNTRYSYEELLVRSETVASGLIALGLPPLARVGIYGPNSSQWVIAQFAASLAGLVLVNINPSYQRTELKHALKKVQVSALIMAPGFKHSNYIELVTDIIPELNDPSSTTINSAKLPDLKHCLLIGDDKKKGFMNFSDLYKLGDVKNEEYLNRTSSIDFEDPTNIQFTSGTTGTPKAATLTHFNLINNGFYTGEVTSICLFYYICLFVYFFIFLL
jgi:fatty-acyl-CoA synthase